METKIKKFYTSPTTEVVEVHVKTAVLINTSAEGLNWEDD